MNPGDHEKFSAIAIRMLHKPSRYRIGDLDHVARRMKGITRKNFTARFIDDVRTMGWEAFSSSGEIARFTL